MSIKPKIEEAIAATAERLHPGSGPDAVKRAKNDLGTIDASSENLGRRFADDAVAIAAPVVFEAKHPEGDPVTIGKRHDGHLVVFPDSLVYVRGLAFGAREVKVLSTSEITVEPVTMLLDGAQMPGVRIGDRRGKPHFAAGITLADETCDPTAQQAVRDEICTLLAP
jgi:hypothetical protein